MTKRKRAAIYASENQGPGSEWDGRPGRFMRWLRDNDHPNQNEQEKRDRKTVSDLIQASDTTRMVLDKMVAVRIFETRDWVPWETRRKLMWPSEGNFYLEYTQPIILTAIRLGAPKELMQGIIVDSGRPRRKVTKVMTIITKGSRMGMDSYDVNLEQGIAVFEGYVPKVRPVMRIEKLEDETSWMNVEDETGRALAGLAAMIKHPDTKITRISTSGDEEEGADWQLITPR